ncbi:MAG: alpha/beta hydrolase [Anaerolineae bacterium]|nr:alpha/beta hydrolase [Anaerolineae bacterium]
MTHWTDGYVDTNGINIHYTRTGGDKPTVVLCHGFSDHGLCWTPVARELEADYDVIMVDARCHGKSDAPEKGNNSTAMADDLAGLIQRLGLDKPVVAGHSMGAGYTQNAAARYPHLMRAIVLEDPGWRDFGSTQQRANRDARVRAEFAMTKEITFDEAFAYYRKQFNPAVSDEMVEFLTHSKRELSFNIFNRDRGIDTNWRELLAKIKCPLLLLTGNPDKGALVTEASYTEAIKIAPQIERVHVDTVGHLIRYEAFDMFMGALKPFLDRVYGISVV